MPSTFDQRVSAGLARLHARSAVTATYRRGATELEISLTWGGPAVEEFETTGTTVVSERASAIVLDYAELLSQFGVPQIGDEIEADGIVRRVLPMDDNGPAYRFSGNARQALRIHTKIVEES